MHETAIVTKIIEASCAKARELGSERVISVTLRVGEIRDFQEDLVQRYFDWFSKGTLAEGATVDMVVVPVRFMCAECGTVFQFDMWSRQSVIEDDSKKVDSSSKIRVLADFGKPACPYHPEARVDLISGNELSIEKLVIE